MPLGSQAIITTLHFIRAELVVAADYIPRKNAPQDIERKTLYDRQDIKVLLFLSYKLK